jgi:hypothetical protein
MKGVCEKIAPLCTQYGISFFLFVPDEIRSANIPIVENTRTNKKLRIAALVVERGSGEIEEAKKINIPFPDEPEEYDQQYRNIVESGMRLVEKHECPTGKCRALWIGGTKGKDHGIFDRDTFIKAVIDLKTHLPSMCINMESVFPDAKYLRIYSQDYTESVERIEETIQTYTDCVFVFGMEYFDTNSETMEIKFIYGGAGGDVGCPEISFIRDHLDC